MISKKRKKILDKILASEHCCQEWSNLCDDFEVMIENHKQHMEPVRFAFNMFYLIADCLYTLKESTKPEHVKALALEAIEVAFEHIEIERLNAKSALNQPVNEELGHSESGSA